MENETMSMKLLIDTKKKRVMFAEAGKEVVDFLFQILSLPVATIVGNFGMDGSLPNLYKSLENLNDTYILPEKNKATFLKPVSSVPVPLLAIKVPNITKYDKCTRCYLDDDEYYDDEYDYDDDLSPDPSKCHACRSELPVIEAAEVTGEIVKGVVTYMVMDDLVVKPMSNISSLTLLNKFNVKDVAFLEEKVVTLGFNEAVKLLKTSLQSKKVLTKVFC